MGNVCRPCGFTIDEGMKVFSLVEMFMAIYHVIVASSTGYYVVGPLVEQGKFSLSLIMILIFLIVFMIGLCAQALLGIMLYFLGFKKRNVTICLIWTIVASINFFIPWFVICFASFGNYHHEGPWTMYYLYLLYLIVGVWVVVGYMRWAKNSGVAVHYFRKSENQPSSRATTTVSQGQRISHLSA